MCRLFLSLILWLPFACVGCTDPCDPAALRADLARAQAGDTVRIGACAVEGPLFVPSGVTLAGEGPADTVVLAPAGGFGIELEPGPPGTATQASSLAVEVNGTACAGIVSQGVAASPSGGAALVDVEVRGSRGVGVVVESLADWSAEGLRVRGPALDPETVSPVPMPPFSCASADPATHGVVLVDVTEATVRDAEVSGFAAYGVLAIRTGLRMEGALVNDNIGVGLQVFGGTANLTDVDLRGASQSLAPIEAYNGVFAGGAEVTTLRLGVYEGDTFGVMHDDAAASHVDLVAERNGFAGVWVQRGPSFQLSGADSRIADNGFAGIAIVDTDGAVIRDAEIAGSVEGTQVRGVSSIVAADGIHLLSAQASVENVSLLNNARAGLTVDLGGASTSTLDLAGIEVRGVGAALGAIAQNGSALPGWDDGVSRAGAVLANDASFSGALDIADAVGPSCLPDPSTLAAGGIGPLIRP